MKKSKIIIIAFVILIILTGCSQEKLKVNVLPQAGSVYNIVEVVDNSEKDEISELMVFKIEPYQFDKQKALSIAEGMEIHSSIEEYETFYLLRDGNKSFSIEKESGSYSLFVEQESEEMVKPLDSDLTTEDYIALAEEFIENTGIAREGLSKTPKVYEYRHVEYIDEVTGKEVKVAIQKAVHYDYESINGCDIAGVRPRLVIAFNYKGDVVEVLNPWRYYSEYKTFPIITREEAVTLLKNNDKSCTVVSGSELDDTIVINKVEFAYYNEPIGYDMDYLLPYYYMKGTNENGQPVEAYVRAISSEYVEVITEPDNESDDTGNSKDEGEFDNNEYSDNTSKLTEPETEQEAATNND